MPPKATKRKKEGLHDDGPWGSSEDRPRKKTRASTNRLGDQDEGHSSQANKYLSGWVAWQNKFNEKEKTEKRQFADDFKEKLQSKQMEIQNLINACNHELTATGDKYSKLVKEAHQDNKTSSKARPQPQAFVSRAEHPLFKAGQHIFQTCRELVAAHERANSKASQDKTKLNLPREQWKEDIASVQELLLYGRQHGENLVDCVIIPSGSNEEKSRLLTPDTKGLSETGTMAVNMYRKSTGAINGSGPTWGELAKSHAGAFGKILEDLADA
ncbi:hypothetical protein INS49_011388 [Diaporthe citri]|uniref:uncharacterized protein n=1 Tax=Diaporthe citri TaxID=83186 RepID=UPI001C7EDB9A|nr:uncharacterized protein INS49_011388 [Diaporthe citri]KAG6360331.1 hypothetical protein INS49_011388 [Diaporthe citri]